MPRRPQPGLPFPEPAPRVETSPRLGDPWIEQLATACRDYPARAKWVVVPSRAVGLAFADRVARRIGGWANLHVVTPLDLAIRMAAPVLLERGMTPSEASLGPAVMMRLLQEVREGDSYFGAMADQPSLAAALWRTVRELRLAGVGPSDLPSQAFASDAKRAELVAVLVAYEQWLEKQHVADDARVYGEARVGTAYCPVTERDLVLEWPEAVWDPLARAFLDGLPGERVAGRAVPVAGRTTEGRAAVFAAPRIDVGVPDTTAAARLRWLRLPAGAPQSSAADDSLALFHAGGRHAEIDEVARRILASGRPLDDVEVVCATEDHAWLAWEKAVRLGWKVTVSPGLPVLTTGPGRALTGWCDWIDASFSGSAMRRLLLSGVVTPRAWSRGEEEGGDLSSTRAARLLAEAQPTWGRRTWSAALDTFAAQEDERASSDEESGGRRAWRLARARDARAVGAWARGLLADLPDGDARVPLGDVLAAARRFLEDNAATRNPADGMARVALLDLLDGFGPVAAQAWRVADVLRLVRGEAEGLRAGRDRGRPGHLHISTLDEAGADGRPLVFVVGMEEGRVFPAVREDPILLDAERHAINAAASRPLLRDGVDVQREAIDRRLARLATIGLDADRVVLSYSCRDTREFRDTFASWAVLNAFRLQHGCATKSYKDLHRALGDVPASSVPSSAASAETASGWWLAHARRTDGARAAIVEAHPWLARGLAAFAAREGAAFTEFDGYVPEAAALDPSRSGRVTSVSRLEGLAACPFRFFLEQGLRVNELEEGEPDADAWLDAATRGSELHALYATIMRRARDAGRPVTQDDDLAWAQSEAEAVLERLRAEMPPPSDSVYARESEELLEDVRLFVCDEAANAGRVVPLGFEVGFGPGASADEPLNDERPLVISLSPTRTLHIRGRIDRIDRLAGGNEHKVVDYKTGRYRKDAYDGTFVAGTRLQPMVYGLAAAQLLAAHDPNARVTHGAYRFPTGRGFQTEKLLTLPDAAETRRVIELVVDLVAAGTFPAAAQRGSCTYCTLGRACGDAPDERTAGKSGAPELVGFRKLLEVK